MAGANTVAVVGRASYLNVWEKKQFANSDPQYSLALLVTKKDKKTLDEIQAAINAALEMGKEKYWKNGLPKVFQYPLKDGDIEKADQAAYRGMMYMNVKCKDGIEIYDENRNPLYDQRRLYSGCIVKVIITFAPFDKGVNAGIGAYFNIIQLVAEAAPLDGRLNAEDVLTPISGEADLYIEYLSDANQAMRKNDFPSYASQNYGTGSKNSETSNDDLGSIL